MSKLLEYSTTFLNGKDELLDRGHDHLLSRKEDFEFYMENGYDSESLDEDQNNYNELQGKFADLGDFWDYGLSFDAVTEYDEDYGEETIKYYRYQLSWGGPSEEVRFYPDNRIEFVFLDWFCGVGFNVTYCPVFKFLRDHFNELEMLNFDV